LYQVAGGTIVSPLSTIENNHDGDSLLKIIPNPNNGVFEIFSKDSLNDIEVRLYDVLGKLILEKKYSSFNSCTIDMSSERSGFYLMEVNCGGKGEHYKIVKK
jgi:hypothetical protein